MDGHAAGTVCEPVGGLQSIIAAAVRRSVEGGVTDPKAAADRKVRCDLLRPVYRVSSAAELICQHA